MGRGLKCVGVGVGVCVLCICCVHGVMFDCVLACACVYV